MITRARGDEKRWPALLLLVSDCVGRGVVVAVVEGEVVRRVVEVEVSTVVAAEVVELTVAEVVMLAEELEETAVPT